MTITMTSHHQAPAGQPPQRGRRPGWWLLAGIAVIAVVAGLLAWQLTSHGTNDGGHGGASKTPAAPVPAPLTVGTATADYKLATKEVAGVPRGFPQTVDGAVEASAAVTPFARVIGANWSANDRELLFKDLGYAGHFGESDVATTVAKIQRYYKLSSDGQPTAAQPGDRFYNDCLPQYGMYNVAQISPSAAKPTSVFVTVWEPCIEGIGSPSHIDNLRIQWDWYPGRMVWSDGDWRLSMEDSSQTKDNPIIPKDKLRPNVSVAERAQLVTGTSKGFWKLFTGYSQAWPTKLLGPEPKETQ